MSEPRDIAASGYPAPTFDETVQELQTMADLLSNHGCATTRDLISAAWLIVDIAHKDAHSRTPEGMQDKFKEFATQHLLALPKIINEEVDQLQTDEEKAKFYARMTSLFIQVARWTASEVFLIAERQPAPEPEINQLDSAVEAEIKKLLDNRAPNGYKN